VLEADEASATSGAIAGILSASSFPRRQDALPRVEIPAPLDASQGRTNGRLTWWPTRAMLASRSAPAVRA